MKEIKLLQKIVRTSTNIPVVDRFAWKVVPSIRTFFGRRYNGEQILTEYDDGIKMWVSLSNYIESNIFWQGVEEEDRGQVKLLKELLNPDQVFFDIGANIGVITLIAANLLTDGCVHAFEPSEHHLEKLHRNIEVNDFQNVRVNPFGLSDENAVHELYLPNEKEDRIRNTGRATVNEIQDENEEFQKEEIETRRLDSYVQDNNIKRIDFIKIDVEGEELSVLKGGTDTIREYQPKITMELNRNHLDRAGASPQEVLDYWDEQEYSVYRIGYDGEVVPIHGADQFDEHQNLYCCPQPEL
jgi:FkbM family methyltransferase